MILQAAVSILHLARRGTSPCQVFPQRFPGATLIPGVQPANASYQHGACLALGHKTWAKKHQNWKSWGSCLHCWELLFKVVIGPWCCGFFPLFVMPSLSATIPGFRDAEVGLGQSFSLLAATLVSWARLIVTYCNHACSPDSSKSTLRTKNLWKTTWEDMYTMNQY